MYFAYMKVSQVQGRLRIQYQIRFWLSFDDKQSLDANRGPIAINLYVEPHAIMIGCRARILIADARTELMQNDFDLFLSIPPSTIWIKSLFLSGISVQDDFNFLNLNTHPCFPPNSQSPEEKCLDNCFQ